MRIASILLSVCIAMTLLPIALPVAAQADTRCAYAASHNSDLDLGGVKMVVFDIGPHRLDITTSQKDIATGNILSIRGKACASDTKRLADLVVSQRREGNRLLVRAERTRLLRKGSWSGKSYGYLTLTVTLPDHIAVALQLGSGNATVDGVVSLRADVGSGDLDVRHIRGILSAEVGSGNIKATDIGMLQIASVGSGDVEARLVSGNTLVGSINSGDLRIEGAGGSVRVTSIGSGNASLADITGDVSADRIGSGTLRVARVHGNLRVDRIGSGSVNHREVSGDIRIPDND